MTSEKKFTLFQGAMELGKQLLRIQFFLIYFDSQSDVDAFQANYSNCTELQGYVWIASPDILNFNGLNNINSIGGYLWIYENSNLSDLTGLNNINSIGGNLIIKENHSLNHLTGLEGLTTIGGDLLIEYNYALNNLEALNNEKSWKFSCRM